jgi:hypothetical protein
MRSFMMRMLTILQPSKYRSISASVTSNERFPTCAVYGGWVGIGKEARGIRSKSIPTSAPVNICRGGRYLLKRNGRHSHGSRTGLLGHGLCQEQSECGYLRPRLLLAVWRERIRATGMSSSSSAQFPSAAIRSRRQGRTGILQEIPQRHFLCILLWTWDQQTRSRDAPIVKARSWATFSLQAFQAARKIAEILKLLDCDDSAQCGATQNVL